VHPHPANFHRDATLVGRAINRDSPSAQPQQARSLCTVQCLAAVSKNYFFRVTPVHKSECQRHADWPVIAVTAKDFEDE
jgi:hypothetical protein